MNRTRVTSASTGLLLSLFLVSCASRRPELEAAPSPVDTAPPAQAQQPLPPPPDPAPIYESLERDRAEYEAGIELLSLGEEVEGEARIAEAANGIARAAAECAETEGCDLDRFFGTLDSLLTRQSMAIKRQAVRLRELEASIAEDVEREPGTSPFSAAIPEMERTVSLFRGTELRELITLNAPVNAAIDDWLTWMRPLLMDSYENYQFLRSRIAPIYDEAGLPEALLFAIMATETGGKVHSYSRAGAAGPLQFMRSTGRRYGLRDVDGFDARLDPQSAARASVAYLNDQLDLLNHSLEKALAAYNGGESRMARLHRREAGASLWDSSIYYALPRETREYVPRVLAAALLFLHPEEFDLEFPELVTDTTFLSLGEEISIGELTICLGQHDNPDGWFRTLRNLNPRLNPGERLEPGAQIEIPATLLPVYEERCREGAVLARARELHDANYPTEPELVSYTVRRGDTLGRIAGRHHCVSLRELASLNDVRPPGYVIHVGQHLRIPRCS